MEKAYYKSPIGWLELEAEDEVLIRINFSTHGSKVEHTPTPFLKRVMMELDEYFSHRRKHFDFDFELHGTHFQVGVWKALTTIPYAKTISYAQLAEKLGRPLAIRACGSANGKNPLPIIIPCHRVIASGGGLGGYSGGLDKKIWLLKHEGGK